MDHEFDFMIIINRVQLWDNTPKFPGILVTNGHAPESIFDVELG